MAWPSLRSCRASSAWVMRTASHRSGSGGNGSGLRRTIASPVRSVRRPSSRSSATAGPEAGRGHAEPGVADGIGHASTEGRAEDRGEAAGRVDRAAPAMAEAETLELREGLRRSARRAVRWEASFCSRLGVDPTAEVIDRVVATPQDAPVVGGSVVVEEVARIGHALAFGPADRSPLRRRSSGSVMSTWS